MNTNPYYVRIVFNIRRYIIDLVAMDMASDKKMNSNQRQMISMLWVIFLGKANTKYVRFNQLDLLDKRHQFDFRFSFECSRSALTLFLIFYQRADMVSYANIITQSIFVLRESSGSHLTMSKYWQVLNPEIKWLGIGMDENETQ